MEWDISNIVTHMVGKQPGISAHACDSRNQSVLGKLKNR